MQPDHPFEIIRPLMWIAAIGFLAGFSSYLVADLADGPDQPPPAVYAAP